MEIRENCSRWELDSRRFQEKLILAVYMSLVHKVQKDPQELSTTNLFLSHRRTQTHNQILHESLQDTITWALQTFLIKTFSLTMTLKSEISF